MNEISSFIMESIQSGVVSLVRKQFDASALKRGPGKRQTKEQSKHCCKNEKMSNIETKGNK